MRSFFFLYLLCFCFLSSCKKHPISQLETIKERGFLKVITRNSPTTYYQGLDGIEGFEYELVEAFAHSLDVKVQYVVNDNLKAMTDMLNSGEVDFAAAGLIITPEREKHLMFAPAYKSVTSKLVFKQGKNWPRRIQDLKGKLRVVAHSSHAKNLLQLKKKHPHLHWSETSSQTPKSLLMMVLKETIDYTIVNSSELDLIRRFYPELAVAFTLGSPQELAWAFALNQGDALLGLAIAFFGEQKKRNNLTHLNEKYYGHLDTFDYVGVRQFHQATSKALLKYKAWFIEFAKKDLDWRLLAAIAYQESHWKPSATSYTGVRGLMMLTLNTAKQMGVNDRLDPKQSIEGGANYYRLLLKKIPNRIKKPDNLWFALAGYNVGWGHVEDARILTQKQGANPDKWSDVKEYLPLLEKKEWHEKTKYGYARGNEPVHYVDNIRHYYEILIWKARSASKKNLKKKQTIH
jgi:membrane-bound lytic murein transglycosylase F